MTNKYNKVPEVKAENLVNDSQNGQQSFTSEWSGAGNKVA